MKHKLILLTSALALSLGLTPSLQAHCGTCGVGEKMETKTKAPTHSHKTQAGPKGGKVLESTPLHAEFFVQADKKVRITFYNEAMKPVAPTAQEVKVIAEAKTGKATLEFEKGGDGFLSKTALPEGDGYRIVVQLKNEASAKPQNFRIDYHTELCQGCKRAEYACTCDHAGTGTQSGHGH